MVEVYKVPTYKFTKLLKILAQVTKFQTKITDLCAQV